MIKTYHKSADFNKFHKLWLLTHTSTFSFLSTYKKNLRIFARPSFLSFPHSSNISNLMNRKLEILLTVSSFCSFFYVCVCMNISMYVAWLRHKKNSIIYWKNWNRKNEKKKVKAFLWGKFKWNDLLVYCGTCALFEKQFTTKTLQTKNRNYMYI